LSSGQGIRQLPKEMKIRKQEKGVGLLEVLMAVAVFAIGIGSVAHYYVGSMMLSLHSTEKNQALFLAREGVEAVRSIGCDEPEAFFEEVDLGEGEGVVILTFKGTLSEVPEGEAAEVFFQWGPVDGSDPLEEYLTRSTGSQTMSEGGEFSHEEEVDSVDFVGKYAYRAVAEMDGGATTIKGDIRIIP